MWFGSNLAQDKLFSTPGSGTQAVPPTVHVQLVPSRRHARLWLWMRDCMTLCRVSFTSDTCWSLFLVADADGRSRFLFRFCWWARAGPERRACGPSFLRTTLREIPAVWVLQVGICLCRYSFSFSKTKLLICKWVRNSEWPVSYRFVLCWFLRSVSRFLCQVVYILSLFCLFVCLLCLNVWVCCML